MVGSEIRPGRLVRVVASRPKNNFHVITSVFVSHSYRTHGIPPVPTCRTTAKTHTTEKRIADTVTDLSGRGDIEDQYGYGYGRYSPGKQYVIFSDAMVLVPLGSFQEFISCGAHGDNLTISACINIRRTLLHAAGMNETLETAVA